MAPFAMSSHTLLLRQPRSSLLFGKNNVLYRIRFAFELRRVVIQVRREKDVYPELAVVCPAMNPIVDHGYLDSNRSPERP